MQLLWQQLMPLTRDIFASNKNNLNITYSGVHISLSSKICILLLLVDIGKSHATTKKKHDHKRI